jgi:hypothetical protein
MTSSREAPSSGVPTQAQCSGVGPPLILRSMSPSRLFANKSCNISRLLALDFHASMCPTVVLSLSPYCVSNPLLNLRAVGWVT